MFANHKTQQTEKGLAATNEQHITGDSTGSGLAFQHKVGPSLK